MERPDHRRPGDHPGPPADIQDHKLPIRDIDHVWFRVHGVRHGPIYFGRLGNNRFDAPHAEFGMLYVGMDAHCAVVETVAFVPAMGVIAVSSVAHLALASIETNRPLRLVDLTADGLVRLGGDARLTTGASEVSQSWSHAFWQHPSVPDGLLYRSRHDPSRMSAAIYDRAADAIAAVRLGDFGDPGMRNLLQRIIAEYGCVLVED